MYIPKNLNSMDELSVASAINEFSFGVLVSSSLEATHLPFLFEPPTHNATEANKGYLYGHFAKANPHWQALNNQRVLVIFSGPHAYISPTWYASKPAVPTWNYVSVHCYGRVELLNDEDLAGVIDALTDKYESQLARRMPESDDVLPSTVKEKLFQAIVGFRVVIEEIHAKEKLGQHRSREDQMGVHQALRESSQAGAKALVGYMEKRRIGIGTE